MIGGVLGSIRWSLILAVKLGRVALWRTSLIILLTLVSQVSQLLASVLPLKVVILLGSEGVPGYLPEVLVAYGRDLLIVGLSIATVGFFLVHLLVEQLINVVTAQTARLLLVRNHKMVLFENQDEVAASTYHRFSRALAGGVFTSLALLGIVFLYLDMTMVLAGYIGTVTVALLGLGAGSKPFRDRLENRFKKTVTLVAGFGFFISFAYVVVDFILLAPPTALVAIVSLLLSRQLLNRLAAIVEDIRALYAQRVKIDALFFHGKIPLKSLPQESKTVWPLLEPATRGEWVTTVLKEFVHDWQGVERIEWHPSSTQNVSVLEVEGKLASRNYLIKLFEANRKSLALHESTLLSESPDSLPGPELVGTTQVGNFACLVYQIPSGLTLLAPGKSLLKVTKLRKQLLTVEPPVALVQRYRRSRPLLWQRVEPTLLKRLSVAVILDEQERQLEYLLEQLPVLKQYLSSLPLAILNPEMRLTGVWSSAHSAESVVLNWERWTLEPVGAKWPVGTGVQKRQDQVGRLAEALKVASETRSSLRKVRVEVVELAALVAALEERCHRQQFSEGLELVDRILKRLNALAELRPIANELRA